MRQVYALINDGTATTIIEMIMACLERRHCFLFSRPPLNVPGPFLMTGYVEASDTFTYSSKQNDPSLQPQGRMPFLFTLPLLLCPLGMDLISFLSDLQIDENLSSSPSLPEPQTVAWAGHAEAVPAAIAERGVIYIFIRNSVPATKRSLLTLIPISKQPHCGKEEGGNKPE